MRTTQALPEPTEFALLMPTARKAPLTRREVHILSAVAEGLGNKQIARRLGISENTVRNHLVRVFDKMNATNRTEAVIKALRSGLQII